MTLFWILLLPSSFVRYFFFKNRKVSSFLLGSVTDLIFTFELYFLCVMAKLYLSFHEAIYSTIISLLIGALLIDGGVYEELHIRLNWELVRRIRFTSLLHDSFKERKTYLSLFGITITLPVFFITILYLLLNFTPSTEDLQISAIALILLMVISFTAHPFLPISNFYFYLQKELLLKNKLPFLTSPFLFPEEISSPVNPSFPLLRKTTGFVGPKTFHISKQKGENPHIIFLSLESLRADYVNIAAPFLREYISKGVYFKNAYATSPTTQSALMASLFGVLPSYNSDFIDIPLIGLGDLLEPHGYQKALIQASPLDFLNQRSFLERHNYQLLFDTKDISSNSSSSWGVLDEELYHFTLPWLERQTVATFLSLFTISAHHPFNIPESYTLSPFDEIEDTLEQRYAKCCHYADYHMGQFLKKIDESPLGEHCIFFIFGDHGVPLGERGSFKPHLDLYEENIRVPLLIYGKNRIQEPKIIDTLASHIDLLPTVMDMLELDGVHHSMGHSLMRENKNKTVYFNNMEMGHYFGLRNGNLKYLHLEKDALYNLDKDPLEKNSHLCSPKWRKQALEIRNFCQSLFQHRRFAPGKKYIFDFSKDLSLTGDLLQKLLKKNPDPLLLNLSYCFKIQDSHLSALPPSLHHLILSNLSITDRAIDIVIKKCENLENLDLSDCLLLTDQSLKTIGYEAKKLKTLILNGITDITDQGLHYLAPISLHTLSLAGIHNITNEGLKYFSSLQSLTLSCKNVTDEGLKSVLTKCKKLETLVIYDGEGLTDNSFSLFHSLPLKRLKISPAPHLTIASLKAWQKLPLLSLSLSGARYIDNEALQIISTLPLQELVITNAHQITEEGLEILKTPSLEYLHMINCPLLQRRSEERIIHQYGPIERVQSLIVSN